MIGGQSLTLAIDAATVLPFDIWHICTLYNNSREETFNIFLSQRRKYLFQFSHSKQQTLFICT